MNHERNERPGAPADGPAGVRRLRSHGRSRGHTLRAGRATRMENLLPALRIEPACPVMLDPASLFAVPPRAVWLEVGFGGGEHLLWQAERHPEIGFLGAEPFVNGVASLLAGIAQRGLSNIRVHDSDARDLMDWLVPASIGRAFILFPDPWPKARHHKRRIVNAETVALLARIVAPGGTVRIASDIAGYQRWILEHFLRCPDFAWTARCAGDWRDRPADWPATRYESKARAAGRTPAFLTFARV